MSEGKNIESNQVVGSSETDSFGNPVSNVASELYSPDADVPEPQTFDGANMSIHGADHDDDMSSLHRLETQGTELLRSVTQYTEMSAQQGKGGQVDEKNEHGFFAKANGKARVSFLKKYTIILLVLGVFVLAAFSIYWGSMYNKSAKLRNLKILVVVEDSDADGNVPFLSEAIYTISENPEIYPLLGWDIYNRSTIQEWINERSEDTGLTINEEIVRRVHRQTFWGSIFVNSNNVSDSLLQAFETADSTFNTSNLITSYSETGRDFSAMSSYVNPFTKSFERAYGEYLSAYIYPSILANLTSDQFDDLRTSAPTLLSTIPKFNFIDGAPYSDSLLVAPLQVGIIYLIILTFFQFMWFMPLHGEMATHLTPVSYILYRIVCSQVAFLVLSLFYSCVNAAFQVNFNVSWKGGFGVQWMISYLTMSAVGGANENIALICMCTIPPLMGFWMLFWVVINIAPTFSPLALISDFYRYGYAFPIHNTYEAMKCLLFGTWRGELGRNIGILVAWSAINIIVLPFCLLFFANQMKKKGQAAAAAAAAAGKAKQEEAASTEKDVSSDSV